MMRGKGRKIIQVREVLKNNLLLMTNTLTTWAESTMALQHYFQDYPHLEDHAGLSRQTTLTILYIGSLGKEEVYLE